MMSSILEAFKNNDSDIELSSQEIEETTESKVMKEEGKSGLLIERTFVEVDESENIQEKVLEVLLKNMKVIKDGVEVELPDGLSDTILSAAKTVNSIDNNNPKKGNDKK